MNRLANALRHGLGIGKGERVSIIAENCLECYEFFHARAPSQ